MFYKLFIAAMLLCCGTVTVQAQNNDSLFVTAKGDHWCIHHVVQPGETLFMLSRRFHVPPAILAGENSLNYTSTLQENTTVDIPIGGYNILKNKPQYMNDARPLYHRITAGEKFSSISHNSTVSQQTLEEWNHLLDNTAMEGDVLFVGWVLYDATEETPAKKSNPIQIIEETAPPVNRNNHITYSEDTDNPNAKLGDTATTVKLAAEQQAPEIEKTYLEQTSNETNVTKEKGAAAFFEGGMHSDVYYAFHNNTPKGTIIKVYNPGTGKTIYVKVLGPIPPTKQYYNCVIGISAAAKKDLGVVERKAWCDLTFAAQ